MMPILHAPGVIIPGQFGPISRDFFPRISAFTRIISIAGIPSVMHTTRSTPASTASRIESAAAGAGPKTIEWCHSTSWRLSVLDVDRDAALCELGDGRIDVIDFESNGCPVTRRFPRWMTTNSDRCRTDIVLDPRSAHRDMTRLQLERLLIKFPCALGIGNRDGNKRHLVCNHLQTPFWSSGLSL